MGISVLEMMDILQKILAFCTENDGFCRENAVMAEDERLALQLQRQLSGMRGGEHISSSSPHLFRFRGEV